MNDEKKKLAIVVVLFSVMACVGVFQVLGKRKGPATPEVPISTKVAAVTTHGTTTADSAMGDKANPANAAAKPAGPKNPEVAADLPPRDPFQAPAGMVPVQNGGTRVVRPGAFPPVRRGMSGRFPPLGNGMGPAVPPLGALRAVEEKPFGWHLVGVIGGANPAAMFEDGTGNQKLVTLGSAIDPDSRLKGIEDDAVSVEFRGKRLRLTVGGNPVGK